MKELEKDSIGKEWLKELEKSRYPWFYISTGTGWYHTHISWNDNLNIPFDNIRTNIRAIKSGKELGRPTADILKERDRIATEYRNLIKTDADREAFDQGLGLARLVLPYAEDHNFYVEHWFHTLFWAKVRQVGQILANAEFFGEADDVWFLKRDEIKQALWDHCTAWATGVKPRGPSYWPKEIAWRKGVYQKFKEWTPPAALGTPPDVVTEPFTIVLWGVTNNVLQSWLGGAEGGSPDEIQGSPGVVWCSRGKGSRVEERGSTGRSTGRGNTRGNNNLAQLGTGFHKDRRGGNRRGRSHVPRGYCLQGVRIADRCGNRQRNPVNKNG